MSGSVPPIARVHVPPSVDVAAIIRAAGGDPAKARYDAGTQTLEIRNMEQAALEAAVEQNSDHLFADRAKLKQQALRELNARIEAGMPWMGKVADIDDLSTARMTSVTVAAQVGLVSGGIEWRMHDNSMLMLDAGMVVAMASAAFGYVNGLRQHYWSLVDAVMAAPDAEALAVIDPTADWPVPNSEPAPAA